MASRAAAWHRAAPATGAPAAAGAWHLNGQANGHSATGASAVVRVSQHERLIDAMIDVAASRGYGWGSVARVSLAAGVSTATFYELFADREDCLLAAYRTVAARLCERAGSAGERSAKGPRGWCAQARSAVEGALEVLEQEPNGARLLLFEAPAAGDALAVERALTEQELVRRADELLHSTPAGAPVLDLPAVALVGAIRGILAQRLLAHEQLDAPVLAGELVGWVRCYARRDGVRWSAGPHARLLDRGRRSRAVGLAVLPRGRHGLPAAAVSRSQRVRMINATAQVIVRKGYAASSVRDIVAAARVSRAVFYEQFNSKQHALLEAKHAGIHAVLDACHAAFDREQPWPARVWEVLRVLLDQVAAGPELAHLCMLDCYAAGPEATRQAEELIRFFTVFLEEGYLQRPAARRLPDICPEAIAGAIHHIIRQAVAASEAASLPQRLPELAYIATVPFLGASAAAETIEHLTAT